MAHRLHCFGESGNAYKAALTLELASIPWEPVFVDFFHGATRKPEFLALNEMGEIPVLETEDGQVLTQSGVIQFWAVEQSGRFGGTDATERREILRWILWDNHKLSSQAGTRRFLMNFLPEEKRPQEVIRWLGGRLQAALATLDRHLSGREWIVGREPSIADFACCGYLFYPEPFGFERSAWPAIDRWLGRIEALPGWRPPYELMPGNPAERAGRAG